MHKPLKQRQREASWRQARLELLNAYEGRSDTTLQQELDQAKQAQHDWDIAPLEREQRQRAQWLHTFLEADAAWLQTALEGKAIPDALWPLLSGPLRSKGLDYLLPAPAATSQAKPRF